MSLDPNDPPICLHKLYVTAAQIDPSDYPATPAEEILQVYRLSDADRALMNARKSSFDSKRDLLSQ
jgi:hypothetical protein